jgi:hypothetical protein
MTSHCVEEIRLTTQRKITAVKELAQGCPVHRNGGGYLFWVNNLYDRISPHSLALNGVPSSSRFGKLRKNGRAGMLSQTGGTLAQPVDLGYDELKHYKIPQPPVRARSHPNDDATPFRRRHHAAGVREF